MPDNFKQSATAISVVIPARNEEAYLGACLDDLVPQLHDNDEIIVVDNASEDNTSNIAKSYSGVKLLHESKIGRTSAQAKGFDAANNQIIARLDADTIPSADWLEQVRQFFLANPQAQLVSGTGIAYDTGFQKIGQVFLYHGIYGLHAVFVGHKSIWGSNNALKKEIWLQLKDEMSYHPRSWEDFEFALHAHRAGIEAIYNPNMFVLYSQRNGVVSPSLFRSLGYQFRSVGTYFRAGAPVSAFLTGIDRILLLALGAPFVFILRISWYLAGRPQP